MKKLINILFNNYYFCLFYLFTSFSFITPLMNIPYINLLPKIAIIWGIIISINNIITIFRRKPISVEFFIILLLVITLLITLFVYNNTENLKTWIINLILLTAVFYVNFNKNLSTLYKEIKSISIFYIILTTIFSSISIILFVFNKNITFTDFNFGNSHGVFTNENSLGIASAISILISLYLIRFNYKKVIKILLFSNILIQIVAVIISNSRSTMFVLFSVFLCYIVLKIKNNFIRGILILTPFFLTILCMFFNHDMIFNFTSGRNELWLSAYEIIKNNFLFGIGNSDLVQVVSDARYIYLPGITAGGLHNIYIQILTANGIFAFISFISLILVSVFYISNSIKIKDKEFIIFSLLLSIIYINLFESNIYYIVSFISIIFWIYLGYLISIIKIKKI